MTEFDADLRTDDDGRVILPEVEFAMLNDAPGWSECGGDVWVSCPECDISGPLERHSVQADGRVLPSLVCSNRSCDFHEYVRLEGWVDD